MTCDKVTYDTYQEAMAAIKKIAARKKCPLRTYKCKDCGKFHHSTDSKQKFYQAKDWKYRKDAEDIMHIKQAKFKSKPHKRPEQRSLPPTTQKLLSPLQAQILKHIINNGIHSDSNHNNVSGDGTE